MDIMQINSEKLTGLLSAFFNKKIKKSGHTVRISIKEVNATASASGISFNITADADIPYSELAKIIIEGA